MGHNNTFSSFMNEPRPRMLSRLLLKTSQYLGRSTKLHMMSIHSIQINIYWVYVSHVGMEQLLPISMTNEMNSTKKFFATTKDLFMS